MGSNPGRRGGKPATNLLSYGMAKCLGVGHSLQTWLDAKTAELQPASYFRRAESVLQISEDETRLKGLSADRNYVDIIKL
jgi:hypothetical protein